MANIMSAQLLALLPITVSINADCLSFSLLWGSICFINFYV